MLEYFTYKKVKQRQAAKATQTQTLTPPPASTPAEGPSPLLTQEDENFLERIVSAEGTPPPLPERSYVLNPEAGDSTGNQAQMVVNDASKTETPAEEIKKTYSADKGKGKEKMAENGEGEKKKNNRFSFITRVATRKNKKHDDGLEPTNTNVSPKEVNKEEDDINAVLDDLNLSAVNNRAFSISKESQVLVQKFTVILKDLVNGVPTAYDDLVGLIEDSQGTLAKSYDSLPSFLQKLITQLPNKLTTSLAPELLAVAAEAQALNGGSGIAASSASGGLKGAAMNFLKPTSLKDLVTKPGAVAGMLKAIMNALKVRWPAFMGTNVLLSLGLFVLLFVFWYCYKRGREVRLLKESIVDSEGRVVELDDDSLLGAAGPSGSATAAPNTQTTSSGNGNGTASGTDAGKKAEIHERR